MTTAQVFRGFRFPAEVILWAVRWYLQFPVSYRDLEAMLADRGVAVDHVSLYRWVQRLYPVRKAGRSVVCGDARASAGSVGMIRWRACRRRRPPTWTPCRSTS